MSTDNGDFYKWDRTKRILNISTHKKYGIRYVLIQMINKGIKHRVLSWIREYFLMQGDIYWFLGEKKGIRFYI